MKKNHIICLALCCVLLINLAGCKKADDLIYKAENPQTAQLPNSSSDGASDTDALSENNKASKNDRDKQLNQPEGSSDGLSDPTTDVPKGLKESMTNLISKAQYPQMAQYPDKASDGTLDDAFIEMYKAWKNDLNKQLNQPDGYSDGLEKFFTVSSKQFLSKAGNENRVYSPLNVFVALGMLSEITDGNSRKQILDLVGINNIDELRAKVKAVWNANYRDDGIVKSVLASSLWLNKSINFKKDTIKSLCDNYYASSFSGEMGSKELNTALQNWLNEQTGDLLKEQAEGITTEPYTVMALATAIFYKASWRDNFKEEDTVKRVFHSASGDIECDFMNQRSSGEYYKGEGFTAANQSLSDNGNMWFILPDENVSVDDFLKSDSMSTFFKGESPQGSKSVTINKSIPKFDVSSDLDLIQGLKTLGVTDVFDSDKSDFTPLATHAKWLDVTKAKHAARVQVDEKGCTATTYTEEMAVYCGESPPNANAVNFVLDRPFIFMITSKDGLPLFVGVVNNVK